MQLKYILFKSFSYSPANKLFKIILLSFFQLIAFNTNAQKLTESGIKLGAYYFDGWTGKTNHISKVLRDSFPDREPIGGWVTSTADNISKQIDLAANSGLSFFTFCWYYSYLSEKNLPEPRNNALNLYLQSKNRNRLNFNLLVVNHPGYTIGPNEWNKISKIWLSLMKQPGYVKVSGKPLLTFFSVDRLVKEFGSEKAVSNALDSLRQQARSQGLGGVTFAACIGPYPKLIQQAKNCGYDVFTGYNYHEIAFTKNEAATPIDSLISKESLLWDKFTQSNTPYIPVTTLNFDPRAWRDIVPDYNVSPRYIGFSSASVYRSLSSMKKWMSNNNSHTTKEKIAMVYAWNEYGEGAWLTPTSKLKNNLLNSLKKAISN
jgi:hypothetical protein